MKNQKGFTLAEVVVMLLFVLGVYGYCSNIYQIVTDWVSVNELGIVMVLRLIGIIAAPLGVIMGFIPG